MPDAPRLRRPRAITLVLLGTAALSLGACESRETRCIRARAENRPDAETICAAGNSSSSRSGTSWFGWSSSGHGTSSGTSTAGVSGSSARGGFGTSSFSSGG